MYLSKNKTRVNQLLALLFTSMVGLIYFMFIYSIGSLNSIAYYALLGLGAIPTYFTYHFFTKKYRDRKRLTTAAFPITWRSILEHYVLFYRGLDQEEKKRFEIEVQIFLHEIRIKGIKTEVDDTVRVLAAASAIIPVFSFPKWEYNNLKEILIYPQAFTRDFRMEGFGRTVTGMVGTGLMKDVMILSKPALIRGYLNPFDKRNVGIHEFVHLIDAADGSYDGMPRVFLEEEDIDAWTAIMGREVWRIGRGESSMDRYALTNPTEFFAVASEFFFEHPMQLQYENLELYNILAKAYRQDTRSRFQRAFQPVFNYNGVVFRGNEPTPCDSRYEDCMQVA